MLGGFSIRLVGVHLSHAQVDPLSAFSNTFSFQIWLLSHACYCYNETSFLIWFRLFLVRLVDSTFQVSKCRTVIGLDASLHQIPPFSKGVMGQGFLLPPDLSFLVGLGSFEDRPYLSSAELALRRSQYLSDEASTKTAPGCSVNVYLIRFMRLLHVLVPSLIYTSQIMDAVLILAGLLTAKHSKLTDTRAVTESVFVFPQVELHKPRQMHRSLIPTSNPDAIDHVSSQIKPAMCKIKWTYPRTLTWLELKLKGCRISSSTKMNQLEPVFAVFGVMEVVAARATETRES
ncbi:hypothetical protein VNO77_39203 [Canavalia gladiata]|uniref:Uncharacterized protein n=1 Tax=Canavalia gladiata TaxID=3824 RepID=A0AAN9KC88_CANGL